MPQNDVSESVVVVGFAGRFPQALNIEQYWRNLAGGKDCFSEFTIDEIIKEGVPRIIAERPEYVKRAPVLEDPYGFDIQLFRYVSREAECIDPQQRILLECAWEALEHAGHDPQRFPGLIGVWAGSGLNNYFCKMLKCGPLEEIADFQAIISNDKDYLASRIAYKLGLRGPAVAVQTACSTSLVAVNMACLALLTYQCDMALAGAVSLQTPRARGYLYREGEIFSPDGVCRAFDKGANGTVLGEGCGLVVLRRLKDAVADGDNILALIRGSAVNNDGAERAGYTAPGMAGQIELVAMAQAVAGVRADEISYIEAHGTGTQLGDPIEVAALTGVFRRDTAERGFCGIGSVKNNIGHLDAAAGIAGLIKTICAIQHRQLPPTIHYTEPNPELRLSKSPFYVVDKLMDWQPRNGRRIAAVSSFGMGGTNAHVILEEYRGQIGAVPPARSFQLLPISAATPGALNCAAANLAGFLKERGTDLYDAAWTLAAGRTALRHRRCVVADSADSAASRLLDSNALYGSVGEAGRAVRPIVFLFSGQGTQYPGMGAGLYKAEPVFRNSMNECARLIGPVLGRASLVDILYGGDAALADTVNQTAVSQMALFAFEFAMTRLLISLGIRPSALAGHSIGEYVAACEAGVFSQADALFLVKERGLLMQSMSLGSMTAIPLCESETRGIMGNLDLAVVNGPGISVVSGSTPEVEHFERKLAKRGIMFRRLHTLHGFHSRMMEPAAAAFAQVVRRIKLKAPNLPLTSNVSGGWLSPEQAGDPDYWADHLRRTVRFGDNLLAAADRFESPILLEVGPGNTLCAIARQHSSRIAGLTAVATARHPHQNVPDDAFFLRAIGTLWCQGAETDLVGLFGAERRARIVLPTYPFEHQRFCFRAQKESEPATKGKYSKNWRNATMPRWLEKLIVPGGSQRSRLNEEEISKIWCRALGRASIGADEDFFELGGHSLLAMSIIIELDKTHGIRLPLASLIEAPTVKEFTKLVERRSVGSASPYLVPLNTRGSKPPFFLLHSHGGTVLEYHPLAKLIEHDRPVFAVQCRGLNGSPIEDQVVEEMALQYLKEIRSVQPHGPYYLGGYCFGGYLALEIAHLLRSRDEEVKLLVFMNSATHLFNTYDRGTMWVRRIWYALLDRMEFEWDELAGRPFPQKWQRIVARANRLSSLLQNKLEILLDRVPAWFPFRIRRHSLVYCLEQVAEANDRAWERYRAEPYDGKVLFFRAQKQPRGGMMDELLGWRDLLKGELHVYEIPGFRQNMLHEPNVSCLADIISEHLP